MSKFQIITLAIFVVALIAGVVAFATYRSSTSQSRLPPIVIWGVFPAETFKQYVGQVNNTLSESISVQYVQKSPESFSQDFVKALALGQGPDAILITADMLLPQENKLTLIPYDALPRRTFMDSYIQEAQVYLTQNGILGIPFTVNPLVMYWNRDTFNAAGLATYPRFWDEFTALNQKLTVKDQNGNVRKSAAAMGSFANITNAREFLGSLMLQVGNPVTIQMGDGTAASALKTGVSTDPSPALTFFSQFADPSNANYSWNRGLPADKTAFLSGMLATYFGFAGELADLKSKNANLNFDVAPLPQLRSGGKAAAYARMYGFSIVRASPNSNAAFQIISILTAPQNLGKLSQSLYLPSVLNILNQGSSDPYLDSFGKAALIGRTWLDADPVQSGRIFGAMVDAVTSGQKSVSEAIRDGGNEYDIVLRQATQ
jgi:ABC-type glycerol-3-phosphate transport system substrate-binding protein